MGESASAKALLALGGCKAIMCFSSLSLRENPHANCVRVTLECVFRTGRDACFWFGPRGGLIRTVFPSVHLGGLRRIVVCSSCAHAHHQSYCRCVSLARATWRTYTNCIFLSTLGELKRTEFVYLPRAVRRPAGWQQQCWSSACIWRVQMNVCSRAHKCSRCLGLAACGELIRTVCLSYCASVGGTRRAACPSPRMWTCCHMRNPAQQCGVLPHC